MIADFSNLDVRLANIPWSSTPVQKAQNRETWKVLKESLIQTMGRRKFEWICNRYRGDFNFESALKRGAPLLPKHIELFSIGASQLTGRDIKLHTTLKLKNMTREQIKEKIRFVQPFSPMGNYIDPVKIAGSPTSPLAYFFHDKMLMDKEKQLLFSDVERMTFPMWLERMSKVTVNREFVEGQIIPAPGRDHIPGQSVKIDYYKVYRKIATGHGLVAYALKPAARDSTLKPMIVFRPSQWAFSNEDAFETYLNDAQQKIGELGWNPAAPFFRQLMQDRHFRPNNEMISVAGFSLGGAHAQRFLNEHYDKVGQAVFYADPCMDNQTALEIRDKLNAMPRRATPLQMQIVWVKGDIVHYAGDKHAGWGVTHPDVNVQLIEIDRHNKKVSKFHLHSYRIFDNHEFDYGMQVHESTEGLFDRLDNSKKGPEALWYEKMRIVWGRAAYYSLYAMGELIRLISWIFGMKVLRKSNELAV